MKVKSFSRVQLFATPWTAAYQAPPSMGFSRQEYWSGVPLPSPLPLASIVILMLDEENQILMGEMRGEHVTLLGKQSCLSVSMILGLFSF